MDIEELKKKLNAVVNNAPEEERAKTLFHIMASTIPSKLVPDVMFALANIPFGTKEGKLAFDNLPETPEELAIITMQSVARAHLDELKNGRH